MEETKNGKSSLLISLQTNKETPQHGTSTQISRIKKLKLELWLNRLRKNLQLASLLSISSSSEKLAASFSSHSSTTSSSLSFEMDNPKINLALVTWHGS